MTVANKIIYGNNTLIDLTGDTATASDVRTGIIFHLASGVQTIGSLSMNVGSVSTTDTDTMNLSISNLLKEPSWFILICASATANRTNRVMHIIYDGSSIEERNCYSTNPGYVLPTGSTSAPTFTYSNGTLNIVHKYTDAMYFGEADWELYYM